MNSPVKLFGGLAMVLIAASVLLLPSGCSTDLDVVAEYEDITIVYGLIDANDTTHYVKVNKAFLGPDDAIVMAAIRDSSEYDNVDVRIDSYDDNGNFVNGWTLLPTDIERQESGLFPATQNYFMFNAPGLNTNHTYRLTATVNGETSSEKIVTAESPLIQNSILTFPAETWPIRLVNGDELAGQALKWQAAKSALLYDIEVEIPIQEKRGTEITEKTLLWHVGSLRADNADGGREMEYTMDGTEFYRFLANNLEEENGVLRKIPDGIVNIVIYAGGEELATYIEVANPSSSLIQDKPEYTNVDNGLGIFSCRNRQEYPRVLHDQTLEELMEGTAGGGTGALGFCHPNVGNGEPGSCGW